MATATTILAAASLTASVGKSSYDIVRGRKIEKSARRRLENYERQTLESTTRGLSVPTQGAQLEREETMRTQAEMASLAGQFGARGAGMSMGITDMTRQSMSRISAQLQESEMRLQTLIAQDEARIQSMMERREESDIMGLGSQMAYGQSLRDSAAGRMISAASSATELMSVSDFGKTKLWGNKADGNADGQQKTEDIQGKYGSNADYYESLLGKS